RIETAPQIPGGNRAPGLPSLGHFTRLKARHGLAAEIMQRNCLHEPEIIERQNIRSAQIKYEKHLGCPAAYPADGSQLRDDSFILHVGPELWMHPMLVEMCC